MKNLCLIALLPALTFAFFLPVPPLFNHDLSVSSHHSHHSHPSHNDTDVKPFVIDLNEICPVIHFAETKLCSNKSSDTNTIPPQLCSLLSLLNRTFCQDEKGEKGEKGEKHENENTKFDIGKLSNTTEKFVEKLDEKLYKELDEEVTNYIKNFTTTYSNNHSNNHSNIKASFNPKDLCPVFDLVDKTFCVSTNNKINPKDLCPLLEFVEKELCT